MQNLAILVADDSEDDCVLLAHGFHAIGSPAELHFVKNGLEATDYLDGKGAFADRALHPLPALLMMDLAMPLRNGYELLEWVRARARFRTLPVIVYTADELESHIHRAYELGANAFIQKPFSLPELRNVAREIEHHWLLLNRPPILQPPPAA